MHKQIKQSMIGLRDFTQHKSEMIPDGAYNAIIDSVEHGILPEMYASELGPIGEKKVLRVRLFL